MPATDVGLSQDEIAELDEAARAGRQQAQELRARLAGGSAGAATAQDLPAAPAQPIGGWVAEAVAANAGSPPADPDLVRAAKAGDPDARQRLVDRDLPLVVATARRYRTEGLDFTDLVQEGVVGLLRALEHFDPDRGAPFGAYARWWVRDSLQELRRDFMRPLRLSRRALRELSQLKTEQDRLHQAEGTRPSLLEVAERVGMDRDQAEALVRAETFPVPGATGRAGRRPGLGRRRRPGHRARGRPAAPRPAGPAEPARTRGPGGPLRAGRRPAPPAGGRGRAPRRQRPPGPPHRAAGPGQAVPLGRGTRHGRRLGVLIRPVRRLRPAA
jgi:RNA polymerase sigma factor (sigma-70 family)